MVQRTELSPITKEQLIDYITFAFQGDDLLLSKFHIISPNTLQACAEHTLRNITSYGTDDLEYFSVFMVTEDGDAVAYEKIGFIVTYKPINILISFGINIAYRKQYILRDWLERIKEKFTPVDGVAYVVNLYRQNIRAINFFKRNGFNFKVNRDNIISLWQS